MLEERIAGVGMALICAISLANVIVRYFTNYSFGFTEEVSVFLLVAITLTGTAAAFTRGRHLAMTFLIDKMPVGIRRTALIFGLLVSLLMFGAMAWYGYLLAFDDYDMGSTSMGIGVPSWWYTAWLPVLSVLVCLRILGRLRRALTGQISYAEDL